MIIVVLADTHIPKRARDLPDAAYSMIVGADAIIHAGDVLSKSFLSRLKQLAPVYAVQGNNDPPDLQLPERLELNFEGIRIAIVHDSGASKGRARRLRKWFPQADIVIFGHSHIPQKELEQDLLLFNPGSPTDKRRQPFHTLGLLQLSRGSIRAEIIELP